MLLAQRRFPRFITIDCCSKKYFQCISTLYVAYSFIHRLRYVMYIGYIEYTYVYLVWTYQLKPILCISNIILYVYMQICSVIRRFFFCVCALLNEIELIAYVWIFFLHRTNYILLRWSGLLRELKWNLNKPKFFLYWNLSILISPNLSYIKSKRSGTKITDRYAKVILHVNLKLWLIISNKVNTWM